MFAKTHGFWPIDLFHGLLNNIWQHFSHRSPFLTDFGDPKSTFRGFLLLALVKALQSGTL